MLRASLWWYRGDLWVGVWTRRLAENSGTNWIRWWLCKLIWRQFTRDSWNIAFLLHEMASFLYASYQDAVYSVLRGAYGSSTETSLDLDMENWWRTLQVSKLVWAFYESGLGIRGMVIKIVKQEGTPRWQTADFIPKPNVHSSHGKLMPTWIAWFNTQLQHTPNMKNKNFPPVHSLHQAKPITTWEVTGLNLAWSNLRDVVCSGLVGVEPMINLRHEALFQCYEFTCYLVHWQLLPLH